VTARTWTGATWTVASNVAVNTPATLGSEAIVNGGFDADTNWTKGTSWTIDAGDSNVAAIDGTGGISNISQAVLTANTWYRFVYTAATRVSGGTVGMVGSFQGPVHNATGTFTETGVAVGSTNAAIRSYDFNGTIDNVSFKALTLSELISSVSLGSANVIAGVNITRVSGYQAGIVCRLDSASSPANFLLAVIYDIVNNPNLVLFKCVGGTYTALINTTITYSAGARLVVVCDGSSVSVYYNNAQVGTTQTVSDAGILNNTLHGLFSTDASNTLNDFLVMPRGNANEYAVLNRY
jgi:hypothetical protein